MSIAVELTDRHRNELRVEVPLDATVGALRNAVNGALPRGYVIEEHDVVPKPFAHYVEDDPECFRGPADGWRLAEVFFDELAAEPLEAVRCRATAPLGPPRAVAVLFPGERAVTQRDFVGADAAFLEAAATLRGYAPGALVAGQRGATRGSCCRWRRSRRSCAPVNWPGPTWARSAALARCRRPRAPSTRVTGLAQAPRARRRRSCSAAP